MAVDLQKLIELSYVAEMTLEASGGKVNYASREVEQLKKELQILRDSIDRDFQTPDDDEKIYSLHPEIPTCPLKSKNELLQEIDQYIKDITPPPVVYAIPKLGM